MAAPKRKAPSPPEPKVPRWLSHPAAIVGTVLVLTTGLTYSCTTIRDWLGKYDLWNRGAELAVKHEPQLGKLTEIVTQQAEIVTKQDSRLANSEKSLNELRKIKEREQERLDTTRDYQRQACGEGKLARDLCASLGFSVPAK